MSDSRRIRALMMDGKSRYAVEISTALGLPKIYTGVLMSNASKTGEYIRVKSYESVNSKARWRYKLNE